MGVKGLFNIINTHAANSINQKHMSSYRGTVQAIDASLILYKYCIGGENCHVDTCLHKTCTMLKYGVMPMWIFDGKSPPIKSQTVNKRRKIRENAKEKLNDPNLSKEERAKYSRQAISLSKYNIADVKKLLQLMGITYIESIEEADIQCAVLNVTNVAHGVISEDWDLILFGCKTLLKNFFNKSNVVEIDVNTLLEELNMNLEQLIDLSAILGNDYCQGIIGMRPIDLYNKFKECKYEMIPFLKLLKDEDQCSIPKNFAQSWIESKQYYMNAQITITPENGKIMWNQPDYGGLYKYLIEEKKFDKNVIINKIEELKKMYTFYVGQNYNLGPYNVIRRLR